jgi:hypothetical protein
MAAIDFPASPTVGQLFTAGNGVTYKWSGTIWLPVGGSSLLSIGDSPPGSPGNGQLWWNSVRGELFIYYADGTSNQWVPATPLGNGGGVIQTVSMQTGAMATGTTGLPYDDTIPQITEGDQFMSLAVTPKSATSTLLVQVTFFGSNGNINNMTAALFQDAMANALAVGHATVTSNAATVSIKFSHSIVSGSTAARTFRVRAGCPNGTTTFNGQTGVRLFGGVMASGIVIQEVLS